MSYSLSYFQRELLVSHLKARKVRLERTGDLWYSPDAEASNHYGFGWRRAGPLPVVLGAAGDTSVVIACVGSGNVVPEMLFDRAADAAILVKRLNQAAGDIFEVRTCADLAKAYEAATRAANGLAGASAPSGVAGGSGGDGTI